MIIIIAGSVILACIAGYFIWSYIAQQIVRQEGQRFADEYMAKYIVRCGEDIYISGTNNLLFNGEIMPEKKLIQVKSVQAAATASDETITADERREG